MKSEKKDYSRNIRLVSEYQQRERNRWEAILLCGIAFITKPIVDAGGSYLFAAIRRGYDLEYFRTKDLTRAIVQLSIESAKIVCPKHSEMIDDETSRMRDLLSEIFMLNIGMVRDMAAKYARSSQSLDVEEIQQEGFFGIKRAVERFDPERGHEFSTYAVWWIKAFMKRYVCNHSSDVRIPVHRHDRFRAIRKKADQLNGMKWNQASVADIADAIKEDADLVAYAIGSPSTRVVFLDAFISDDGERYIDRYGSIESLLDDGPLSEDAIDAEEVKSSVSALISSANLSYRSKRVIELRYGINSDGEQRTLEEVGHLVGLTKERIRQIEREAMQQLREAARSGSVPASVHDGRIIPPRKKFGANDVLDFFKKNPERWFTVDELRSSIRWMTAGSIAACIRWLMYRGESGIIREGKRWMYDPSSSIDESDVFVFDCTTHTKSAAR